MEDKQVQGAVSAGKLKPHKLPRALKTRFPSTSPSELKYLSIKPSTEQHSLQVIFTQYHLPIFIMPVVEQQIQAAEPMTATTSNLEVEQPKPAPEMSGDNIGLRGGESAGCECCGCSCGESCC